MKFKLDTLYTSYILLFGISLILLINLVEYKPDLFHQLTDDSNRENIKSKILGTTIDNEVKTNNPVEVPKITLESIFDNIDISAQFDKNKTYTLIVTGDIMPGRTVNFKTVQSKDFTWPYHNLDNLLSSADLTFINLESPLVENCPLKSEGMIFCADTRHIQGLVSNGIDIASLANNHSMNYGINGLNTTVKLLEAAEITATGVNNPQYITTHDVKIALLAYDDVECYNNGVACLDKPQIAEDIKTAKASADLVVIMYHWGSEYTHNPSKRQIDVAHFSIDNGADLVLGNHPHWYQPVEIYKDKLIMYSHGNFIFDQMWSEKTKEGVIGKYTFYENNLIDAEFIPIYIENYGQPKELHDTHREEIIENLQEISESFTLNSLK